MFEPGGALRFFGSALESLAMAAPSVQTLFAAASLVQPETEKSETEVTFQRQQELAPELERRVDEKEDEVEMIIGKQLHHEQKRTEENMHHNGECEGSSHYIENSVDDRRKHLSEDKSASSQDPAVSNDSSGHFSTGRSLSLLSIRQASQSVLQKSSSVIMPVMRSPSLRMHVWFCLSRLALTPALVCAMLVGLDCGTSAFDYIPHYTKMVLLLNSCLPGAVTVINVLKSEGLNETANILAKVYFPSYLLSIFSIAGWSSVGLLISLPLSGGRRMCRAEA
uniref:Uncharacterized protein n=1 Tax=Pseudictyota dubia TaxID=2749911 RepID=A0A7R9Z4P9_9STRA